MAVYLQAEQVDQAASMLQVFTASMLQVFTACMYSLYLDLAAVIFQSTLFLVMPNYTWLHG